MANKPTVEFNDDAHCLNVVRENSVDLYLANLLLDKSIRADIFALHAFHVEVTNITLQGGEPMAAEIRLQWWRDALSGERKDEAEGHPVARRLLETIVQHDLPIQPLLNKVDAHVFDLYNDPMGDRNMFEGYCGETRSSLFQLASIIVGAEQNEVAADSCGHAGVAFSIATIIANMAYSRQHGKVYLPSDLMKSAGLDASLFLSDVSELHEAAMVGFAGLGQEHLAKANAAISMQPAHIRQIFKPLAIVLFYLKQAENAPRTVLTGMKPPSQLRKQWALFRY